MLEPGGTGAGRRCRDARCRACEGIGLEPVLDYGAMPPSDGFLDVLPGPGEAQGHPLELAFCSGCSLLQLVDTLDPDTLFGAGYLYLSSCSDSWLAHCRANAESLVRDLGLDADSLVVELGSNDGYLLQFFRERGVSVLGVDPAPAPVSVARERGIETIGAAFTQAMALSRMHGVSADLVISNNVLAHVADPHDFVRGVCEILPEDGTWVIEVPYALDLVAACAFDTVYHEHLCYFTLTSLGRLLERHGIVIRDVERLPTHGGSLRVRAGRSGTPSERVRAMRDDEQRGGWLEIGHYRGFAQRACAVAGQLAELLEDRAAHGRTIAAYGAAAKGTILLNCLGPAARHVRFAVDRNPLKHGKWIPGVNIPIVGTDELRRRAPDDLLLLPWNLRQEVLAQQRGFLEHGGQFIVPLPRLEVVGVTDL